MNKISMLAAAALAVVSTAAVAQTNYNLETGTGFVSKGDVQFAFGWNNRSLQSNADAVTFAVDKTIVTEVSWECTNANNEKVQERARTTTQSVTVAFTAVTRDRNQVTGFMLTGLGNSTTSGSVTDGPPLNSCPNSQGSWSLTSPAGWTVVVSSDSSLTATHNGITVDIG
jgi:hypothetical protein